MHSGIRRCHTSKPERIFASCIYNVSDDRNIRICDQYDRSNLRRYFQKREIAAQQNGNDQQIYAEEEDPQQFAVHDTVIPGISMAKIRLRL